MEKEAEASFSHLNSVGDPSLNNETLCVELPFGKRAIYERQNELCWWNVVKTHLRSNTSNNSTNV